jgi:hypothetical protein
MRFLASVGANGSLAVHDNQKWVKALARNKGKRVEIELRSETEVRSNRANSYWWGVVIPFVSEQWERGRDGPPLPKETVHDALVSALSPVEPIQTELALVRPRSSRMSVAEFSQMIEAVREWASHKYTNPDGTPVQLPSPEEWSEA